MTSTKRPRSDSEGEENLENNEAKIPKVNKTEDDSQDDNHEEEVEKGGEEAAEKIENQGEDSENKSTKDDAKPDSSTSVIASMSAVSTLPTNGDWTAIWSPESNAYYFWNSKTQETTWVNPFDTSSSAAPPQAPVPSTSSQLPGAATAIDPELAYLDPSMPSTSSGSNFKSYTFQASFNSRTGRFQSDPSMNPERVSEVERMKRQSQFYFDFDGWEKVRDQEQEYARAMGIDTKEKKKKVTKKDVVSLGCRQYSHSSAKTRSNRNGSSRKKRRRSENISWLGSKTKLNLVVSR